MQVKLRTELCSVCYLWTWLCTKRWFFLHIYWCDALGFCSKVLEHFFKDWAYIKKSRCRLQKHHVLADFYPGNNIELFLRFSLCMANVLLRGKFDCANFNGYRPDTSLNYLWFSLWRFQKIKQTGKIRGGFVEKDYTESCSCIWSLHTGKFGVYDNYNFAKLYCFKYCIIERRFTIDVVPKLPRLFKCTLQAFISISKKKNRKSSKYIRYCRFIITRRNRNSWRQWWIFQLAITN